MPDNRQAGRCRGERCASLFAEPSSRETKYNVNRYTRCSGRQAVQEEILDFWFGRPGTPEFGTTRDFWFRKDPAFDAELRNRFDPVIETALAGSLEDWPSPRGTLARVVLLDQFTRNCFRDTPRAFAGDPHALAIAEEAIARGDDRALAAVERWFLYMPFQHAESLAAQERSLELFRRLRDQTALAEP